MKTRRLAAIRIKTAKIERLFPAYAAERRAFSFSQGALRNDIGAKHGEQARRRLTDSMRLGTRRRRAASAMRAVYRVLGMTTPLRIHWAESPLHAAALMCAFRGKLGYGTEYTAFSDPMVAAETAAANFHAAVNVEYLASMLKPALDAEARHETTTLQSRAVFGSIRCFVDVFETQRQMMPLLEDSMASAGAGYSGYSLPDRFDRVVQIASVTRNRRASSPAVSSALYEMLHARSLISSLWQLLSAREAELLHIEYDDLLVPLGTVYEECSAIMMAERFVIMVEKPKSIVPPDFVNDNLWRPQWHSTEGPVADFGETMRCYALRGHAVPERYIMNPASITVEDALGAENIELRSALCGIVGWHKIMDKCGARVIDDHPDPQVGELVSIHVPGSARRTRLLRVHCGTGREFALPVPNTCKTALGAQAWTWGLTKRTFKIPEVRT